MSKIPLFNRRPAIAAGIALLAFSGCSAQIGMRIDELLAGAKAESLEGWESPALDNKPLLETLPRRIPLILRNPQSVSSDFDGEEFAVDWELGRDGGIGAAVPVAGDGYFLTAGHVVQGASSLALIGFFEQEAANSRLQHVSARIVWQPETDFSRGDSSLRPDIGIVHADLDLVSTYTLSEEVPKIDEAIIIAGWPIGYFNTFTDGARLAAGRVSSIERLDGFTLINSYMVIHHSAPTVQGDSGGPVLDRAGNLIGINIGSGWSISPAKGLAILLGQSPKLEKIETYNRAVLPHFRWLQQIIENDRRKISAYSPCNSLQQLSRGLI